MNIEYVNLNVSTFTKKKKKDSTNWNLIPTSKTYLL